MNGKRRNGGIMIDIALLILCFAVFSSCLASGMLAKYTTGKQADPDSARVAAWTVNAVRKSGESDPIAFGLVNGSFDSENNVYTLEITNTSEVAARYTVELVFPGGALDYLTVNHGGAALTPDGNKVTVQGSDLIPASGSATEVFSFAVGSAVLDSAQPDSSDTLKMTAVSVAFDALVKFVQID